MTEKKYEAKTRTRDGSKILLAKCPDCGWWQEIDMDQALGKVSSDCANPACQFHETVEWRKHIKTEEFID